MIGYKDKTWCSSDCANVACHRNFNESEQKNAVRWWGDENFPLVVADFESDCDDYMSPEKNNG